jgi:YD repeat-containing protein
VTAAEGHTGSQGDAMKINRLRAAAFARTLLAAAIVCGFVALSGATPSFAQGLSIPPRQDTRSPTGVSYANGTFTYEVRDLSIGGEFPQGLTFDRTYISNLGVTALGAPGWRHNWSGSINTHMVTPPMGTSWTQFQEPWVYDVSVGGHSVGFRGGSSYPPSTGGPVGTYTPITSSGASLVYTGTTSTNGRYVFTDGDGTVVVFTTGGSVNPLGIQDWTAPDGTRLDFNYDSSSRLHSVISNRGYAIIIEPSTTGSWKVCAVNLTQNVITATSSCPTGVQSVTYSYTTGTYNPAWRLLTGATDANGNTTTYGYVNPDRLGCITLPGQSTCQIQNTYALCHDYYWSESNPVRYAGEYVTSQQDGAGATYGYSYHFTFDDYDINDSSRPHCQGAYSSATTLTTNGTAVTSASLNSASLPSSITDPLGRVTSFTYDVDLSWAENEAAQLADTTHPRGDSISNYYDARGNLNRQVTVAVPGSGLPNVERTAVYPSTCTNRFTCNEPTSATDARGNTTEYTYDPAHGGVLTETGPAPSAGAPRPQTRHEYAQRYTWILASGGGYVQAATPVWVQTATSLCRTSAATGNPAAPCTTAGDEVRATYDYGPNSGPNNLLLRGQAVMSTDGGVTTTLRTCYAYDRDGRRISETQPNANPGSCP